MDNLFFKMNSPNVSDTLPVPFTSNNPSESCSTFYLSTFATLLIPTLLSILSFIYLHGTLTYTHLIGGKVEHRTLLGVIDHRLISPGSIKLSSNEKEPKEPEYVKIYGKGGLTGAMCKSTRLTTYRDKPNDIACIQYEEAGMGSLSFLFTGYPIRKFCWVFNSRDAFLAGEQLSSRLRKAEVFEEERISMSKISISAIDFIFGLIAIHKGPHSIPKAAKAMFHPGGLPDIRIFLLIYIIASATAFIFGMVICSRTDRSPTSTKPSRKIASSIKAMLSLFWVAICIASFAFGCWQIAQRRKRRESVWPIFIYWAPLATFPRYILWGVDLLAMLGTVAVLLGVIGQGMNTC